MTIQEHRFLLNMFGSVLGMQAILLDVLQDRGILTEEDTQKIREVAAGLGPDRMEFISMIRRMYIAAAKIHDLEVEGLEPPES